MKRNLIILFFFLAGIVSSQVATRPSPARLYNNLSEAFPDFLSTSEAMQLEEKLESFSNETSNQICVVIVDDFNGLDGSEYAFKLGTEWGVGKKDLNNGIVILVKPTKENGGRYLEIATGYGLEGAIPDLATKRVREEMQSYLKSGANFEALDKGTATLMGLAKGEISKEDYSRERPRGKKRFSLIVIIIVILLVILSKFFGGGGGGRTFSGAGRALFWGSMFSSGFGGRGGSSSGGGGWGGFGGGSFGGGGSGGSW
ncbi:MAG: TPM domain-containing protein [Bacteroidota bacterium]